MSNTTLGIQELADRLATIPQGRASRVLDIIALIQRQPDSEIAAHVGRTRAWVQQKRTGKSDLRTLDDIARIAAALDVPEGLFVGTPMEATEWLLANKPELFRWLAA